MADTGQERVKTGNFSVNFRYRMSVKLRGSKKAVY